MKTPLEILKECREQLEPKPFKMSASLQNLKNMLEEDINESLIKCIQRNPHFSEWVINIPVKGFYLTTITNIKVLLHFIHEIVEKPEGFELNGALTYLESYNSIWIRFKEVV